MTTMRRCGWCTVRFRSAGEPFCSGICARASAAFYVAASLEAFARRDAETRVAAERAPRVGE
jgi:hypothetical protein